MMSQRIQLAMVALGTVMLVVLLRNTEHMPVGLRNLADTITKDDLPDVEHIGAVHVGKCGGVGLRHAMRHPQTESILKQKKALHWIHMNRVDPYHYKSWIVLIRDPIARIQSNYVYEHVVNAPLRDDKEVAIQASQLPSKAKLYECYNSLDKLVTIGLAPAPPPSSLVSEDGKDAPGSDECRRLAFGLFDGPAELVVRGMPHFSYNYEFYTKELLAVEKNDPETKIWLVRQEHMQDDVDTIDRAMGGDGVKWHMDHYEHVNLAAAKHAVEESPELKEELSKHMSPTGLRNLCRVLCSEIQVYKALLAQAQQTVIGGSSFVEETLAPLREQCPEEVQATECEPAIPAELKAMNLAAGK